MDGKSTLEWDPIQLRQHRLCDPGSRFVPHLSVEENIGVVHAWKAGRRTGSRRVPVRCWPRSVSIPIASPRVSANIGRPATKSRSGSGSGRGPARDAAGRTLRRPGRNHATRHPAGISGLQSGSKTLVFVTHDVREALLLAHRIGLVKDGKMVLLGPPSDLQSNDPEAPFAACVSVRNYPGARVSLIEFLLQSPRSRRANPRASFPGGSSTSIAILIGVPLGILLTRGRV